MGIRSYITDKGSGKAAEVILNHKTDKQALMVATFPYRTFENSIQFFSNDDYGIDMNVDTGALGTPEKVHNGIDDTLWTGSDIVGAIKAFDDDDQNHTDGGEYSVKVENENVNDVFQFAKGSDLDCTDYVALTMWIYVDKDWKAGDSVEIYGWDTGTNAQIGDAVSLEDYFTYNNYDVWQKITIPLTDMGALASSTTLDALRVRQVSKEGKGPKYYLDDIQFEETGVPIAFTLEAEKGTWLHVDEFTISVADALASTLLNAALPYLSYDKMLGETLVSGINYQREQDGEVLFSQTVKNLIEFLQLAGTSVSGSGSDGTNTWVTLKVLHQEPLVLKPENDDKLSWTVSEDLSGLLHFRISAGCRIERKT